MSAFLFWSIGVWEATNELVAIAASLGNVKFQGCDQHGRQASSRAPLDFGLPGDLVSSRLDHDLEILHEQNLERLR